MGFFCLFFSLQPLPRHRFISVNIHTWTFICKSVSVSLRTGSPCCPGQTGRSHPPVYQLRNQKSTLRHTWNNAILFHTNLMRVKRKTHRHPNLANDECKNITQTESKTRRRVSQAEMRVLLPLFSEFLVHLWQKGASTNLKEKRGIQITNPLPILSSKSTLTSLLKLNYSHSLSSKICKCIHHQNSGPV